jgi:hypothetical protein
VAKAGFGAAPRRRLTSSAGAVYFIHRLGTAETMATSKTASFYLTETITLPAGTAAGSVSQASLDIGGLVNIASSEALAVEQVDFIMQYGALYKNPPQDLSADDYTIVAQLTDQNPGTALVRADDNNLIGSGSVNVDVDNNITSHSQDFFPDNFGKLSEAFFAVNDTLYLNASLAGNAAPSIIDVYVTVRIKARIAKLSKQDWMALAITSTANSD